MTMQKHILAALTIAFAAPVASQTLDAAAGAQAVAIVGGGGGSGNRIQGVLTTPDAIAPSSSTAIGGGSCFVPATSDAVSVAFISYGGARWMLDEGCEARRDAEALVGIAYARAELLGDMAGVLRNIDLAERRMTATRAAFLAASDAADQPWPTFWRP